MFDSINDIRLWSYFLYIKLIDKYVYYLKFRLENIIKCLFL